MLKVIHPPNIEVSNLSRELLSRIFPKESGSPRFLGFIGLVLTHKSFLAKRGYVTPWQQDCIIQLGYRYLEVLIAHHALINNKNITAQQLQDCLRGKQAICKQAENRLRIAPAAILPPDYQRAISPAALLELHAGFLGALAVLLPYPALRSFYSTYYDDRMLNTTAGISFKTLLQEFTQAQGHGLPKYWLESASGPDHSKTFQIKITAGNLSPSLGTGISKKKAEEAAAEQWLKTHARLFLQQKLTTSSKVHPSQPGTNIRASVLDGDDRTLMAIRHFKFDAKQAMWVRRALSHPSIRFAGHSLASSLLPILSAIHHDFELAQRLGSADLIDKLAAVFIPAAFAIAPKAPREVAKWRGMGLLGSKLLEAGNIDSFEKWALQAIPFLSRSKLSVAELEERALEFYAAMGCDQKWDVVASANRIIADVKAFAQSSTAISALGKIKERSFFAELQSMLKVLNLVSKPLGNKTSIHATLDSIGLLRRNGNFPTWEYRGVEVCILEREGTTLELLCEAFEILHLKDDPQILIRTEAKSDEKQFKLILKNVVSKPSKRTIEEKLARSILIQFLIADGAIRSIGAGEGEIIVTAPVFEIRSDFVQRAKMATSSALSGLNQGTLSALTKTLHDLKNHLISASVAITSAPKNRTGLLQAQTEASAHLDATIHLTEQFKTLSNVLSHPVIEEISVPEFFRNYCAGLLRRLSSSISLGIPRNSGDVNFRSSPQFLESILENLIKNSVEAIKTGGRIELEWDLLPESGDLRLTVKDNGPGMDTVTLAAILAGKAVESSKNSGTGIGMLTVTTMIRKLGGQIQCESSIGGGTTWHLLLPPVASEDQGPESFSELNQELTVETPKV